jgi:uncharacterized protein (DUF2147 family)
MQNNQMVSAMTKFVTGIAVATTMVVAATLAFANETPEPTGEWRMENGKVTVEVSYCGKPVVCAKIVGLRKPLDKQGMPKVDKENPNPSLRTRPLIGLEIMSGMNPSGANKWVGKIYNADDGNTYKATAVLDEANKVLVVKGHWGPFSKKSLFLRVP